jgi:hypothetical protein
MTASFFREFGSIAHAASLPAQPSSNVFYYLNRFTETIWNSQGAWHNFLAMSPGDRPWRAPE